MFRFAKILFNFVDETIVHAHAAPIPTVLNMASKENDNPYESHFATANINISLVSTSISSTAPLELLQNSKKMQSAKAYGMQVAGTTGISTDEQVASVQPAAGYSKVCSLN